MEIPDSPDVVIAKRLLDHAKQGGFTFQRAAPGADGALVGHRVREDWVDLVHIKGFSRDCVAWRQRTSSLIVSDDALVQRRERGAMAGRHRYRRIATLREILDRNRRARSPVAAAPRCTIEFADGPTGIAHRVTDEAFAAGRRAGGRYVALCGARVLPAHLTAPARFHCPACERGV